MTIQSNKPQDELSRIQQKHSTTPIEKPLITGVRLVDPKLKLNALSKQLQDLNTNNLLFKADGSNVSFSEKKEHWGVKLLRGFLAVITLGGSLGIEKALFPLKKRSHLSDAVTITERLFQNVVSKNPSVQELESYLNLGEQINKLVKKTNDPSIHELDLKGIQNALLYAKKESLKHQVYEHADKILGEHNGLKDLYKQFLSDKIDKVTSSQDLSGNLVKELLDCTDHRDVLLKLATYNHDEGLSLDLQFCLLQELSLLPKPPKKPPNKPTDTTNTPRAVNDADLKRANLNNRFHQFSDTIQLSLVQHYKEIWHNNPNDLCLLSFLEKLTTKPQQKSLQNLYNEMLTKILTQEIPQNAASRDYLHTLERAKMLHTLLNTCNESAQQAQLFDSIANQSQLITNYFQNKIQSNNNLPDQDTKEFLKQLIEFRDNNKDVAKGRVWDMCNSIYESITESYNYLDETEKQIPGLKNMLCLDEEIMRNALLEVQDLFQESVSRTPGDQVNNQHTAILNDYDPRGTTYCILAESPQGIKVHQFVVTGDPKARLLVTQTSKKPQIIPYEKMDDLKNMLKNHKVLFAGEKPTEDDPFKDLQDYSQDTPTRKGG